MLRNLNPKVHHSILQVLELPKQRLMNTGVAVPSLVLTAWERVHVEDGIDALSRACFDNTIDQTEAFLLDDRRVPVIHEVSVVDWNPHTVKAK